MEPPAPTRPEIFVRYKIEEQKEWFILDRDGYVALRDYAIQMEGALDFATKEIIMSNDVQKKRRGAGP